MRPSLNASVGVAFTCWLLSACAMTQTQPAGLGRRPQLDLTAYESAGALTTHRGGMVVEPYFALRALILADEEGLDASRHERSFTSWLRVRQNADGSFSRFCAARPREWKACGPADADDATLAGWLEVTHPGRRAAADMPAGSRDAAIAHLAGLRRPDGVFRISASTDVALLMDNVEVWKAFSMMGAAGGTGGRSSETSQWRSEADTLARNILHVFWRPQSRRFALSTQDVDTSAFYPDAAAQLYPLLVGFTAHTADPRGSFDSWFETFGREWLELKADHYPWGIIAVLASRMGRTDAALCWLAHAEHLRHSPQWNILEETAFQALRARAGGGAVSPANCAEALFRATRSRRPDSRR